jgi:hypothetical protein
MRFIQLLNEEQKLLSNKIFYALILIFLAFILASCGEQDLRDDADPITQFSDPDYTLDEVKKILGEDVEIILSGNFDNDTTIQKVAGVEVSDQDVWGIKFVHFKVERDSLIKVYETSLLDGSFSESKVEKYTVDGIDYELIYYNSLDYFLGSGGGEVFSYMVDLKNKETYYAHLVSEPGRGTSLFLSENITNPEIKNFFLRNFRNDYPSLKLVSEDIELGF